MKLSLHEIMKYAGLANMEETLQMIVEMIEKGHIHAKIYSKEEMVSFYSASPLSRYKTQLQLDQAIHQVSNEMNALKELDQKIRFSPAYLKQVAGKSSRREYSSGFLNSSVHEELLMDTFHDWQ